MKTGGLTQREIKRLTILTRQLSRAVERNWLDDKEIIEAEIAAIMQHGKVSRT